MTDKTRVHLEKMDQKQCEEMLDRNWFGRVAFAAHSRIDIEPLGYVRSGEWLFGRTSHGTKLDVVDHQPWVAFEVDEVQGPFEWKSVVAHGVFYKLSGAGNEFARQTYARAIKAVRATSPDALTRQDPVPHRTVIFGIHINSVSGRVAHAKSDSLPERVAPDQK